MSGDIASSVRTPGSGENVGVISKAESKQDNSTTTSRSVQRVALDTDVLAFPSAPLINASSSAAVYPAESETAGTAQAGAAGTITLAAGASSVTDYYKGMRIYLVSGTGGSTGQQRIITAYNGSTKVATISPNWGTNPDNTTRYQIFNDCEGMSKIILKPTLILASLGTFKFLTCGLLVKIYDDNLNIIAVKTLQPATPFPWTYAASGNYLYPSAPLSDPAISNGYLCPLLEVPTYGAKNYSVQLLSFTYSMTVWGAGAPMTVTAEGTLTLYTTAI